MTLFFGAMFIFFISNYNLKLISHNNIVLASSTVQGKLGKAIHLTNKDYIMIPEITYGPKMTISSWIRMENLSSGGSILSVCNDYNSDCSGMDYSHMIFSIKSDESVIINYSPTQNRNRQLYARTQSGILKAGQWYNIVATIDTKINEAKIFINGNEVKTTLTKVGIGEGSFTQKAAIGASYIKYNDIITGHFNGDIDDIKIWNRVLSDGEILSIPNGTENSDEGLVNNWKFDTDNDNIIEDSINNKNGTLITCTENCINYQEIFDDEKCATWHASNVFNYSPCGNTKIYNVDINDELKFSAYGDNCAGCVCYHPNFDIYEYINNDWNLIKSVDEPDQMGIKYEYFYNAKGSKIKVVGTDGCFHFNLYKKESERFGAVENISASLSNISASPSIIKADGKSSSTIKVLVKTESNKLISGKKVEVYSNRNDLGVADGSNSKYYEITDSRGIAEFKVKSTIEGVSTYRATVIGQNNLENVEIDSVVSVEYISVNSDQTELTCLPDGTLIKMPADPKVYVIKNCQKQWIESGEEFQKNGYDWNEVKNASPEIVNAYSDYLKAQAKLLKAIGQNRIYRVFNEKVLWVPTVSAFNSQGLKWGEINDVSPLELEKYPKIKLIKEKGDDRIFYVTNSGMKKHILTTEVFNSYNNKYEDVVEVDAQIVNSLEIVNLIKDSEDHKVYKIEGDKKKWIKSAEAFNRNKFDWNKIAPSNDTELNAYEDAGVIE